MIGPLSSFGVINGNLGFLIAVLIGISFGFFLERGGLGNPRKLTGVFYLNDFTVPKVMFTAIATASVGLYLMTDLKIIDMSKMWIVPTFYWPQVIGGAIFGVGFVVSGYCPGTAVTGLSSGRIDAFTTLLGVGAGSIIYAIYYPAFEGLYNSAQMGPSTLPQLIHANHWLVVALVVAMAVIMFVMIERFEKRRSGDITSSPNKKNHLLQEVSMATAKSNCGPYF